ncbi:zona pellucida sperm-binding protein 3-like [Indicator indicator]|uniref:zona pellucida sperm-binding protein 3-like n=1 Tax=Indicator indicator TaxID=1002788 RepID=UPI0023DEFEC8|nr:zona pellucida sperm-binding protein 3-like [Indicator indicator]
MKALRGRWWWFVLLFVAAAWAQDAQGKELLGVSVTCGQDWLSVAVPTSLLGSHLARGELTLGSGCGVTAADGDRYWLEHPLVGCGTTLELLPDSIHYSNVLHYQPLTGKPVARSRPFSLPVDCSYPRVGNVSSRALQPNWISFSSTVAHRRRLRFALDVYDSSWSSQLLQPPRYSLGELINVEASVDTNHQLPLRVFVAECVASPSTAEWLRHEVITDDGCLLDGQLGRSRFLPQHGNSSLRFQLDTFLFPNASGSQVCANRLYLRCHLKAVAPAAGGILGKACSYDPVGGLLGEATVLLGPLELLSALPSSSPGNCTAPEASRMPSARPSVPAMRGQERDSRPAAPGTMVAMCCVLLAVSLAGCYCSVRRHRAGDPEAALGEPQAVAMASTAPTENHSTPRTCPAPVVDPSMV